MAMRQTATGEGEVLAFRRVAALGGAEFLRARFGAFHFVRHAHDRVSFGLLTEGALRIEQPAGALLAQRGDLILFNHDQVHWGGAQPDQGWAIRSIYLEPAKVAAMAHEQGARPRGTVGFPEVLPRADDLVPLFWQMHASFDDGFERLEAETRFAGVITELLRRYGKVPGEPTPVGREPRAVARARAYLEAHVGENVSLRALARVAGLSPYRLARAFTASIGMAPHSYHMHLRVRRAAGALRQGRAVAEVAQACGFADQSHLTRAFKRHLGITPGRFRAA